MHVVETGVVSIVRYKDKGANLHMSGNLLNDYEL